ncbi:hypothetical protein B1808_09785 [Pseudofulvimonas gallinarii]|uniref:Putative repeat protein (TIGR01451 family) n=1 Tax=Pseudofulvimonas gallinarii TaxID=634155 RepID=A0A4R3LJZ0_9GAMM|nr:DUF11 domain-containing protein [Pseudofulvimonas gallinarii]TCS98006.1 putative repeat protein (TIGR01451 family) [Pseudofulvimonas gallinarii]THD13156.1 hypothetical protein B1808_09785 [Pseudofulvimonas gallinarii]
MLLQRLLLALGLLMLASTTWAVSVAGYASRDDVTVGQVFSVNVVVVNNQPTAISDFRISIVRPAEAGTISNHTDAVCNPTNCSAGAQINWTQASLAPGETYVATFKTTLNTQANTAGTVVTFPVAISGNGSSLANTTVQVTSKGANTAATSQRLRLSTSTPVLPPGEEALLVASVGNTHATTISFGNTLTVLVPAGLDVVEAIGGSVSGQQVTWNLGALNPLTSVQRLLVVRAAGSAVPQVATVQATLQADGEASTAKHVIAIQRSPRLRVFIEPERTWGRNNSASITQLRVENHGATTLDSVSLRARIAAGSGGGSYPSDSPTGCTGSCSAGNEYVWNVGSLPPGASRIYSHHDLISNSNSNASLVGESIRMEALAISASGRAIATADVAVVTSDPLEVKVNPAAPDFPLGKPVAVEIALGNLSTTNVSLGTTLNLRLPRGLTVIEADGGNTTATGLSWNIGAINPGDIRARHILVQADGGGGYAPPWDRLFQNGFEQANAAGAPLGPLLAVVGNDAGDASATFRQHGAFTHHINPMQIKLALSRGVVASSNAINGEITVSNTGAVDLFGTNVYLRLPAGNYWIHNLSDAGAGAGSTGNGEIVNWSIGQLPAGASRSVSFAVELNSGLESALSRPYEAWARASNGLHRAHAVELLTTIAAPEVRLAVETSHDTVQPGDSLTYTLAYGNVATSSASTPTLRLLLPEGVEFVSASDGGALVGNRVVWPVGAVQPGFNGRRQATVNVLGQPAGSLLATTAVLTDTANRLAHVDVVHAVHPDDALRVAVAMSPAAVPSAGYLSGEVVVVNTSDVDIFDATVNVRVPYRNYWRFDLSDSGTGSGSTGGGEVMSWNVGQLPAGAVRTRSFGLQLRSDAQGGDILSYTAWARGNNGADRAAANDLLFVRTARALRLGVETSHDAVQMGDALTYTLVYGNTQVNASSSATLRLPVPDGLTFVSATDGGALVGGEVVWTLGALPATHTNQRQATFIVADLPEGHLLKTTPWLSDTSGHFAHADITNYVETAPALSVAAVMSATSVSPNGVFSGQVTVTNNEAVDLFIGSVHLRVPPGNYWISNVSDGGTGGGSTGGGELINWNLGTLAAGATRTVTFTAQLRSEVLPGDVLIYRTFTRASSGLDHARSQRVVRVQP